MVKAVFDELAKPDARHPFTVGITDDVTHLSLDVDPEFDIEPDDVIRALFRAEVTIWFVLSATIPGLSTVW